MNDITKSNETNNKSKNNSPSKTKLKKEISSLNNKDDLNVDNAAAPKNQEHSQTDNFKTSSPSKKKQTKVTFSPTKKSKIKEISNELTNEKKDFKIKRRRTIQNKNNFEELIDNKNKANSSFNKEETKPKKNVSETKDTANNTSNNINVLIRVRPFNEVENDLLANGIGKKCIEYIYPRKESSSSEEEQKDEGQCKIVKTVSPNGIESKPYIFDRVFKSDTPQVEIYDHFGPSIVKDVLKGYNATVFAYGQSGSGKTYTMYGPDIYNDDLKGFIPRLITDIFNFVDTAENGIEFDIKMSYLQIYKEVIYDLLTGENNLKIKESPAKGIYVDKLSTEKIESLAEFMYNVELGQANRVVSETRLNSNSSRSHSILIFEIMQKSDEDNFTKTGKLNLVDLAGSEKVSKTGAIGETLEEAKKINLSLSALGNVIHSLTSGAEHIPYRDSKLTRILQESLGGNFKTSLIVTCSPHSYHLEETTSSLNFAERAKKIKNKVKINIKLTYEELQKMVRQLKLKLKLSYKQISKLKELIPKDAIALENNDLNILVVSDQNSTENKNVSETTNTNKKKHKKKKKDENGNENISNNEDSKTNKEKAKSSVDKGNKIIASDISSLSIANDNEGLNISDNLLFNYNEIANTHKRKNLTNGAKNSNLNGISDNSQYLKEEEMNLDKLNDSIIIEKLKEKVDLLNKEIKDKNQIINKLESEKGSLLKTKSVDLFNAKKNNSKKKESNKDIYNDTKKDKTEGQFSFNEIMKKYEDIDIKISSVLNKYESLQKEQINMNIFNEKIKSFFQFLTNKFNSEFNNNFNNSSNGHLFLFNDISDYMTDLLEIYKNNGNAFETEYFSRLEKYKEKLSKIFDAIFQFSNLCNKSNTNSKALTNKLIQFISLFVFSLLEAYCSLQLTAQLNFKLNNENLILSSTNHQLLNIVENILKSNIELCQNCNNLNMNIGLRSSIIENGFNLTFADTKSNRNSQDVSNMTGSFINLFKEPRRLSNMISKKLINERDNRLFKFGIGSFIRSSTQKYTHSPFNKESENKEDNLENQNLLSKVSDFNVADNQDKKDNGNKNENFNDLNQYSVINSFISLKSNIQKKQKNIPLFKSNSNNEIKMDVDSLYNKASKKNSKLAMIKQFLIKSLEQNEAFKKEKEYLTLYFTRLINETEKKILEKLIQNKVLPQNVLNDYNTQKNVTSELALLHKISFSNSSNKDNKNEDNLFDIIMNSYAKIDQIDTIRETIQEEEKELSLIDKRISQGTFISYTKGEADSVLRTNNKSSLNYFDSKRETSNSNNNKSDCCNVNDFDIQLKKNSDFCNKKFNKKNKEIIEEKSESINSVKNNEFDQNTEQYTSSDKNISGRYKTELKHKNINNIMKKSMKEDITTNVFNSSDYKGNYLKTNQHSQNLNNYNNNLGITNKKLRHNKNRFNKSTDININEGNIYKHNNKNSGIIKKDIESIISDYIQTGTATRKFDGISVKLDHNKFQYIYNSGLSANNTIVCTPLHKIESSKGDISVDSIKNDDII